MTIDTLMHGRWFALLAAEGEGGSGGSGGAGQDTSTGEGSGEGKAGEGNGTGGDDNSANTGQGDASTVLGNAKPGDDTSESGNSEGEKEGENKDGEGTGEGDDGPPEEYTFDQLPEGMEVDNELAEKVTPIFKELGLTNEQANKLASEYAQHISAQEEARAAEWQKTNEAWKAEAQKDPTISEMGWDTAIENANRFIQTFGDDELNEALATGLNGNHPAIIRALAKAGAALGDDRTETGTTGGQKGDAPVEERWYGAK